MSCSEDTNLPSQIFHLKSLISLFIYLNGGLAQLARASALHAEGQRFDSVILHQKMDLIK